jgi:hypothetical protein
MLRAKSWLPAACCKFVVIVVLLALGASDYGCEAFTSSVIVVSNSERLRFISSNPNKHSTAWVLRLYICSSETESDRQRKYSADRLSRDYFPSEHFFHAIPLIDFGFDGVSKFVICIFRFPSQGRTPCLWATAPDNDSKEGKDSNNENKKKPPPPKAPPLIIPDGNCSHKSFKFTPHLS